MLDIPSLRTGSAKAAPAPENRSRKTGSRTRAGSGGSASGTYSEDEFFDTRSHMSGSIASSDSVRTSLSAHKDSVELSPTQRQRSHTSSFAPPAESPKEAPAAISPENRAGSRHAAGSAPPVHSSLRRSATTRHGASIGKAGSPTSIDTALIEERARRAVKAMAVAATTGVSIRESDERRERAFNHLLVGRGLQAASAASEPNSPVRSSARRSTKSGSSEQLATVPRLKSHPLHQVSSHSQIPGLVRGETEGAGKTDQASEGGTTSEVVARVAAKALAATATAAAGHDGRTLSMTHDRKTIALTRSASLEARISRSTRKSMAKWIMCFATVNFDVDQGPTLSLVYPHVPFSDSERAAICFSSMPDSTIYELYDSVYTFHFRVDPVRLGLPKDQIFLYGHVFFRQKRDPLMRRGGFQRSVAIISHLPYHGLFTRMAHMLGPLYFDLGTAILEAAAHNISSWPAPTPGASLELPFVGTALTAELPANDSSQLLETSKFPLERFDPGEHILASVTCDGLFRSFRDTLGDLWACWELMILGESLVVLADTPARCSEAIVSLVDIIFPITYCGDYRPYFTIQDPDFRAIISKTHVPANMVVGVSNPFFSEAMAHWPHKLFLGSSDRMSQMHGASARKARVLGDSGLGAGGAKDGGSGFASDSGSGPSGAGNRAIKQGLQSKRKSVITKDRPFAEHLLNTLKTGKQPPWIVNNMLRRYFIDLTVQFLAPLNRYFSTLIPQVASATVIPVSGTTTTSGSSGTHRVAPWHRGHRKGQSSSSSSSIGGMISSPDSLSWFTAPAPLRPWRTGDFMTSLTTLGISPQLSHRNKSATPANIIVSAFSANSANGTGSGSPSSSGGNHGAGSSSVGGANSGGSSYMSDSAGAAATGSSSSVNSSGAKESSQSAFSLWRQKKASKKTSDEWLALYSQFLQCGNFATWLAHRTSEAQRELHRRFRQEVCQGDVHAWCRGYDYPLSINEQQLAAEIEMLDLATMDLGQGRSSRAGIQLPHVSHVFYQGQKEDERAQAERQRRQLLKERQERLAWSERPVHGSDGTLIGYSRQSSEQQGTTKARATALPSDMKDIEGDGACKQLGQRITHAKRTQSVILRAAWQVVELLGESTLSNTSRGVPSRDCPPPSEAERHALLRQLSVLLEYLAADAGQQFLPLVTDDYASAQVD